MKRFSPALLALTIGITVQPVLAEETLTVTTIKPLMTEEPDLLSPRPLPVMPPLAVVPESDKSIEIRHEGKTIEIVFAIDTTGSMGGLIQGAKTKVWSIINDVLKAQGPGTQVKVGLVAYRDRGDRYVTQMTPLSEDLDNIYGILMGFEADGGGDTPEDVREAMRNGVEKMNWSKPDSKTSQILFLVGDAPSKPYKGVPDTLQSAGLAKEKGIIVNTIQCGVDGDTKKEWMDIAKHGGGEYFAIAQDGGTREISTPYDDKLVQLNEKLSETYIPYGSASEQAKKLQSKSALESKLKSAPKEAQAERALNKSMNTYGYSSDDIVQSYENKTLDVSTLKHDYLPEAMKGMSEKEQQEYLLKISEQRKNIKNDISHLAKERAAYIQQKLKAENKKQDGFDSAVSDALKKQMK